MLCRHYIKGNKAKAIFVAHLRVSAYAGDSIAVRRSLKSWKHSLSADPGTTPGLQVPGSPRFDRIANAFFITCTCLFELHAIERSGLTVDS